ncbi:hypothetical protein V4C53_17965 [Paraburkholderia azotifigens]|uniref:hypothetical protein n=1 Tax=Paraburkholderia azotifigens TaxID=2057004 RepID=UPI00317807EC
MKSLAASVSKQQVPIMDKKDTLINTLRAAAELSRALVGRDVVRRKASGDAAADVIARLKASHGVYAAALKLAETAPVPKRIATGRDKPST